MINTLRDLFLVDKRMKKPVPEQVFESVQMALNQKKIKLGFKFPDPNNISDQLNISIEEINSIYDYLKELKIINDDLVIIKSNNISSKIDKLSTLTTLISNMGLNPTIEMMTDRDVKLKHDDLKAMGFSKEDKLAFTRRIHYGDENVIAISDGYYLKALLKNEEDYHNYESYNEYFSKVHGLNNIKMIYEISGKQVDDEIYELLNVEKGSIVFVIYIKGYDENNKLFKYGITYIPSLNTFNFEF